MIQSPFWLHVTCSARVAVQIYTSAVWCTNSKPLLLGATFSLHLLWNLFTQGLDLEPVGLYFKKKLKWNTPHSLIIITSEKHIFYCNDFHAFLLICRHHKYFLVKTWIVNLSQVRVVFNITEEYDLKIIKNGYSLYTSLQKIPWNLKFCGKTFENNYLTV